MKIILIKEVKGLGKISDIVEVKDGYGTFLCNNQSAVLATSSNIATLHERQELKKNKNTKEVKSATNLKQILDTITLHFSAKKGKDNKMFGSISAKQVAAQIFEKQQIEIDKRKIDVSSLNQFGTHKVTISLGHNIVAIVNVEIISE